MQAGELLRPRRHHHDLLARRLRAPHRLAGRFPNERSTVEHPFSGEDEVGLGERGVEPYPLEHPFGATRQVRLREVDQPGAEAPRRTTAWQARQLGPPAPCEHLCQPLETRRQMRHVRRGRSLLRRKHLGRPLRTNQRRRHIGEPDHPRREPPSSSHRGEHRERPAAFRERAPLGVGERPAQTARRPRAAIHRRRATQPHNHGLGPAIDRLEQQLTHTAAGRSQRIPFLQGDQGEPAGARAFEDGGLRIDPAERGLDGHPQRPGDTDALA